MLTSLLDDVRSAAALLPPAWPLRSFVAANPLHGLEDRPFDDAVAVAGERLGAPGHLDEAAFRRLRDQGHVPDEALAAALRDAGHDDDVAAFLATPVTAPSRPMRAARTAAERWDATLGTALAAQVDEEVARVAAAWLGRDHAGWAAPAGDDGLWPAWRSMHEPTAPAAPSTALNRALRQSGVPEAGRVAVLEAHLLRQPGWAAQLRAQGGDEALVDLLAVRLHVQSRVLGMTLGPDADRRAPAVPPATTARPSVRARIWQDALERGYRDRLLRDLDAAGAPAPDRVPPRVQAVFCIDVRSEPLRRHLERQGAVETFGFAGFFGIAMAYRDLASGAADALCPVLLEPQADVRERGRAGAGAQATRHLTGRRLLAAGDAATAAAAKGHAVAPFALAEAAGWLAGPGAAARTAAPGIAARLAARLKARVAPPVPTAVDVASALPLEQRVAIAASALKTIGLTAPAPVVLLCGHGSQTANNPHRASLDCGACGGHAGAPNARAMAAILNDADVRTGLKAHDIGIPATTWFVAGEHETTGDTVTLFDTDTAPAGHQALLAELRAKLGAAADATAVERLAALPGGGVPRRGRARAAARVRGADWAQTFPEWGLAGNAAFIVAPRSRTEGLDLGGRTFLHSYAAELDEDGSALEVILTAPLIVAQWINHQYYFSTVAPDVFGAGSKVVHNPVGGIGVLSGPGGDLRLGLPWQSVADGDRLAHPPLRLLAAVEAPLERIDAILERHEQVRQLLAGDWIAMVARATVGDDWHRWTAGGWTPWTAATTADEVAA